MSSNVLDGRPEDPEGKDETVFSSLEICAGGGGLALGLEGAGFHPVMLIDEDPHPCRTLRANRPEWRIHQCDVRDFVGAEHPEVLGVDLMSCGIPGTAYSPAGRHQGNRDRRDLLTTVVYLATEIRPRILLIECTDRLLNDDRFEEQRRFAREELAHNGYRTSWEIIEAKNFGVAQRRTHSILIAMQEEDFDRFRWPEPDTRPPTVGEVLRESMAARGWNGATEWAAQADRLAPMFVGGTKSHGGADLGPTGTKKAWAAIGVNGWSLGDEVPDATFTLEYGVGKHGTAGLPRLTTEQVALLQGFPPDWVFTGGKTARYRQIAQCVPPPLAQALGRRLALALDG